MPLWGACTRESEAYHIALFNPRTCMCTHVNHLSKAITYFYGEADLDTLVIDFNSFFYSKHKKHVLDKMTNVFNSIYATLNNKVYGNASIDTLAFKLDSMFVILVFETDLSFELGNQISMDQKNWL